MIYQRGNTVDIDLTPRERQILDLLREGCGNKEVGRRLGITEATVKVHLRGLLAKINCANRTQAAVWWERLVSSGAVAARPEDRGITVTVAAINFEPTGSDCSYIAVTLRAPADSVWSAVEYEIRPVRRDAIPAAA